MHAWIPSVTIAWSTKCGMLVSTRSTVYVFLSCRSYYNLVKGVVIHYVDASSSPIDHRRDVEVFANDHWAWFWIIMRKSLIESSWGMWWTSLEVDRRLTRTFSWRRVTSFYHSDSRFRGRGALLRRDVVTQTRSIIPPLADFCLSWRQTDWGPLVLYLVYFCDSDNVNVFSCVKIS